MAPSFPDLAGPLDAGPLGGAVRVDPDADQPVDDAGLHPVLAGDEDHGLGEAAHVAPDVAAVGPAGIAAAPGEIEDGVADELARPVVGHVAAAAGLDPVDAARRERLRRVEDVARLGATAERDHRLVLDEQHHVADRARAPRLDEVLLEGVHGLVATAAEPGDDPASRSFGDLAAPGFCCSSR